MIKRIVFGILTLVFAITAILMSEDMKERKDVPSVLMTFTSIFLYSWCGMTTLE